jgi:hypothetical protein
MKKLNKYLVLFLCTSMLVISSQADIIINSYADGSFEKDKKDYSHSTLGIAGKEDKGPESRAYFAFDLSSVSDEILGATFEFNTLFISNPAPELELKEVKTDVNTLVNLPLGDGDYKKYYDDLGKGKKYANKAVATSFVLNADALTELNKGGLFAIGVKNKTKDTWIWSLGAKLTLTTAAPEPAEILLILAGIGLIIFIRRKQLATA